jgi:hypothetical protein
MTSTIYFSLTVVIWFITNVIVPRGITYSPGTQYRTIKLLYSTRRFRLKIINYISEHLAKKPNKLRLRDRYNSKFPGTGENPKPIYLAEAKLNNTVI